MCVPCILLEARRRGPVITDVLVNRCKRAICVVSEGEQPYCSSCAYCLSLTLLNPLQWKLAFHFWLLSCIQTKSDKTRTFSFVCQPIFNMGRNTQWIHHAPLSLHSLWCMEIYCTSLHLLFSLHKCVVRVNRECILAEHTRQLTSNPTW